MLLDITSSTVPHGRQGRTNTTLVRAPARINNHEMHTIAKQNESMFVPKLLLPTLPINIATKEHLTKIMSDHTILGIEFEPVRD